LTSWDTWSECNCKVNYENSQASEAVYSDVKAAVDALIAANSDWENIKLSGYSFGASIAMFTGHMLVRDNYSNVKMINFAQPRNGDNEFAAFSNAQWTDNIRFTNNKDVYSQVPPQYFGYEYSGAEIH